MSTKAPISIIRLTNARADFEADAFELLVIQKGLKIRHEKNIPCPCRNETSGQPNIKCADCVGVGYIFKDPQIYRGIIQSINFNNKGKVAGKLDEGTASLTMQYSDRIAWMDRITVLDGEDVFYEVVYPRIRDIKDNEKECSALTVYESKEVKDIYLYINSDTPSQELILGTDFEIKGRKIVLSESLRDSLIASGKEKYNLSIRYTHNPQYLISYINKNIRNTRVIDQGAKDTLKKLPLNCSIRKVHFILGDQALGKFDENNI